MRTKKSDMGWASRIQQEAGGRTRRCRISWLSYGGIRDWIGKRRTRVHLGGGGGSGSTNQCFVGAPGA